ncbi:MAG TPA: hypothetical protein PKD49_15350 [Hyphomicrobium sp.]|nr:hypothetical protein [Hyphomicrobium sp.]
MTTPDDVGVITVVPPLQVELFDFLEAGNPTPRQKELGWALLDALMFPEPEADAAPDRTAFDWPMLETDLAEVHDFVMSDESTDETFEILVMQLTDTAREVLRFHREGASDKVLAEVWLELVNRHRSYSENVARGEPGW